MDTGGLKLQVVDDKLSDGIGGMMSRDELVVGEAFPGTDAEEDKMWVSLMEGKDSGDLTTDPGVKLGSSSILFNGFPWYNYQKVIYHFSSIKCKYVTLL